MRSRIGSAQSQLIPQVFTHALVADVMRSVLIALALLALAAPAALGHPERHAFFPDGSVGAVPKHRKTADQVIYVCKKDSAKRVRRSFRHQPTMRARRLRQLERCQPRNIQAAG